jgi:hypothetical protein
MVVYEVVGGLVILGLILGGGLWLLQNVEIKRRHKR